MSDDRSAPTFIWHCKRLLTVLCEAAFTILGKLIELNSRQLLENSRWVILQPRSSEQKLGRGSFVSVS